MTKSQPWIAALLLSAAACAPDTTEPLAAEPASSSDTSVDLRGLAAAYGWERLDDETIAAINVSGENPADALGVAAVLVTAGEVFRVPREDLEAMAEPLDGRTFTDGWAGDDAPPAQPQEPEVAPEGEPEAAPTSALLWGPYPRNPVLPELIVRGFIRYWNLSTAPYRQIAQITIGTNAAPIVDICSGSFIGPRHVLTSGHCFDVIGEVLPLSTITVRAGTSSNVTLLTKSTTTYFRLGTLSGTDLALVVLPDTSDVANTGWYGWELLGSGNVGNNMRIYGYPNPSDLCFSPYTHPNSPYCGDASNRPILWGANCWIDDLTSSHIEYKCDQSGGMSGGPISRSVGTSSRVAGVIKGHLGGGEVGQRLTQFSITSLCTFAAATPSVYKPGYNCFSGATGF